MTGGFRQEPLLVLFVPVEEGGEVKHEDAIWSEEYPYVIPLLRRAFEHQWVTPETKEDDPYEAFFIPRQHFIKKQWSNSRKAKPAMCCYMATKAFCANILGVGLHRSDENFYEDHPLVVPEGLPMADTLRVVQETISPYGLRITRLRMVPGYRLAGDLLKWTKWLGLNPMAAGDRCTTNVEFAEAGGEPLEEINRRYAFEFGDEPLRPSIHCNAGAAGWSGHAEYLAPREEVREYIMSFQLGRVSDHPWQYGEPEFRPIEELLPPIYWEVSGWDCFHSLGKEACDRIRSEVYPISKSSTATAVTQYNDRRSASAKLDDTEDELWRRGPIEAGDYEMHERYETVEPDGVRVTPLSPTPERLCVLCGRWSALQQHERCCTLCWSAIMSGYSCRRLKEPAEGCQVTFSYVLPISAGVKKDNAIHIRCAKCSRIYAIPMDHEKALRIAHNILLNNRSATKAAQERWLRWRDDELRRMADTRRSPVDAH